MAVNTIKLIVCVLLSITSTRTYSQDTMYAINIKGINLFDSEDTAKQPVRYIPYGTPVLLISSQMNLYKISHEGNIFYAINKQLIPYPIPKAGTHSFEEYAAQTAKLSDSLNLSKERTKYAGYISELKKTYYANGITVTDLSEHEYQAETITIPNITIQQAYYLLQNIAQLQNIYPLDKIFPEKNYSEPIGKPWDNRNITIIKNEDGMITKVEIYADMGCRHYLSFIFLPGEVAVTYECAL